MALTKTDVCVIGAGSGGLSVAAAAVQMGAQVVLIEADKMGGDCLNYGCVPSKSLLAVAKRAAILRYSSDMGLDANITIDFARVHHHIHHVIAQIAPNDSEQRFTDLGVDVIRANAHFINSNTLQADNRQIQAKWFVIASGSSPFVPPVPGLDTVDYLTNETIFDLTELPEHLIIMGGGPIGCELAQAMCLLGAKVTIIEMKKILPQGDMECVDIVRDSLQKSGVTILQHTSVVQVSSDAQAINVLVEHSGGRAEVSGSHLLVAAGRTPNLSKLQLGHAGVKYNPRGVEVDSRLRSSNKRIFAIGDAAGHYQFTHVANYHAGIVIRNALFRLPAKVNYRALPWVIYTEPEFAHVGLNVNQAKQQGIAYRTLTTFFDDNDRAQTEHDTRGMIKIVVTPKARVLGATIVGREAGELIQPWVMAIDQQLKLSQLASMIVAYPTLSEISKHVASSFYSEKLFSNRVKKLVQLLLKF